MPNDIALPDPKRFDLASFADILPDRDPIVGEDPGSFDSFHDGMMRALAPATPYECVVAENLIAIEWELLQHRRMREAGLRGLIREAIRDAVIAQRKADHEDKLDADFEAYVDDGGDKDEWVAPFKFDELAAEIAGDDLADRAVSLDRSVQAAAYEEISALGMEPLDLMGEAYRSMEHVVTRHESKARGLETRRREVKRDYDALVKARPVEAEVIEA